MLGTKFYKEDLNLEEYTQCAMWCNNNNATIEDKGTYYECVEIPAPPIEEIKASKIAELKTARDTEEISPIPYGGYMWDFDDKAQMRISGAITVLGDKTITWTSADNQEIKNVNAGDLKGVVGAAAIRSNAVHVKYRELKAMVEQAKTIDDVNAIHW